ncbi:PIN domain-containing protein [Treponema primitia]|uniref:PIN domain-containing protein n=1 Tax=Treponema primitia TaxID=88058 RepID=UPI00397F66F4
MEIYMDCCCLNRPFDDQTQDKIHIESDTIMAILWKCFYGKWLLIGSDIVTYEIMKTPDLNKRNEVLNIYSIKKDTVSFNGEIQNRALELQKHGLKAMDSLHFASAEYKNVSVLLTVDKDFVTIAKQIKSSLLIENPVTWYMKEIENE